MGIPAAMKFAAISGNGSTAAIVWPGGRGVFVIYGTIGGGTYTLQMSQRCGTGAELPCCDHRTRAAASHRCVQPKPPPCIFPNNRELRHPENRRKYLSYRLLRGRLEEQLRPVSGCRVKSPQSYVPRLGS